MADHGFLFQAGMVLAQLDGRKTQTRRGVAASRCTVNGSRERASSPAWKGLLFDHPLCVMRSQSTIMRAMVGNDAHHDLHLDVPFLHPDDAARGAKWEDGEMFYRVRPIVEVGDRLWVRETLREKGDGWTYDADGAAVTLSGGDPRLGEMIAWAHHKQSEVCTSIHMPRWASRLTWLVTDVRLQRLQEISRADALAEGVEMETADPPFYYVPGIWPHGRTAVGIEEPGGRHAERSYGKLWNEINGPSSWDANPWVIAYTATVKRRNVDR